MSDAVQPALQYVDEHREQFLEELKDLIRIPSISTLPKHRKDMRRAARFVADQLTAIGLRKVRLIKTAGHPLVYGEWLDAPGKPTALLYGHYDVQPVDPLALWESPPFEPTIRGDNLYARGAVDDKGQMFAIVKALEALMRTGGTLPLNVRVLIEGEEEAGGESIEHYVVEHPERLGCDVALIVDTGIPAPDVPSITYGVRGIIYAEIEARGAKRDLHSGEFGGIAPNAIHALAVVLAGLKDARGHIHIPGLYDKMRPATEEERRMWARNPADMPAIWKREMGLDVLPGEPEYDPIERNCARPTFEVHGIIGGFTGDGAKTVIPAEVRAKVSLRLVPDQRPKAVFKLLERRVQELCPPGVTMTVTEIHGGDAVVVPLDNVYIRAAERAVEQEWGKAPVFERSGGSIPIGALFDRVLGVPVVFLGAGLPDDNIHAPNEKFHLPYFYRDIRQILRFLHLVGNDPAIAARPNVSAQRRGTTRRASTASSADGANGAAASRRVRTPAGKKA
ncbi:MAG TPA: dipeptidase [Ktedonobacterales bacterium]|jgi:acetylornithine deacetylase/succinyl-diaminopimelate desuccinylase-like protein|nr:dipeptidase [Ktedonobacterales bacterium]